MPPTVAVFVGLDYFQHAVQVCVLDPAGKALCNRAVPDAADAIAQVAQRFLGNRCHFVFRGQDPSKNEVTPIFCDTDFL
jgi:hypothetical protein